MAIHQPVLKSTTSARGRDALDRQERRDSKFEVPGSKFQKPRTLARLACPASLARPAVSLGGLELPLGLRLEYSDNEVRSEGL